MFLHAANRSPEALQTLSKDSVGGSAGQILRGDILRDYELPARARDSYLAALDGTLSQAQRDDLLLRLARLSFDQQRLDEARLHLQAMAQDAGPLEDEKKYLLARIALQQKQIGTAARLADQLTRNSIWQAYLHYDLGIALSNNWQIGRQRLDKINHMVRYALDDPEYLALADQANLALARISLDKKDTNTARIHSSRIRKDGPFSNIALLTAGWTSSRGGNQNQALAHWLLLRDRNQRDKPSMEVLIAIPQAYEKLGNREVALLNYELAASRYAEIQQEIDSAVVAVSQGVLLQALREGRIPVTGRGDTRQVSLPGEGLFAYLFERFAEPDFQLGLQQYLQLLDIRVLLERWQRQLPALQWSAQRQASGLAGGFQRLQRFGEDGRVGAYQQRLLKLYQRLDPSLVSNTPRALANDDELRQLRLLDGISASLRRFDGAPRLSRERARFRLLSGVKEFRLRSSLPERIEQARGALDGVRDLLKKQEQRLAALPRMMNQRLDRLRKLEQGLEQKQAVIDPQVERVSRLIEAQGAQLNDRATALLASRREHLDKLYLNARHSHVRVLDQIQALKVTP